MWQFCCIKRSSSRFQHWNLVNSEYVWNSFWLPHCSRLKCNHLRFPDSCMAPKKGATWCNYCFKTSLLRQNFPMKLMLISTWIIYGVFRNKAQQDVCNTRPWMLLGRIWYQLVCIALIRILHCWSQTTASYTAWSELLIAAFNKWMHTESNLLSFL